MPATTVSPSHQPPSDQSPSHPSPTQPSRSGPAFGTAGFTAELVERWASSAPGWLGLVEHVEGQRWYRLLSRDRWASVWVISWAPGSGIDLHDHDDSAGSFAVIAGSLRELYTSRRSTAQPRARTLSTGSLVSMPANHVHLVRNESDEPAISVHAYAPALGAMGFYALEQGGKPQLVDRRPTKFARLGSTELGGEPAQTPPAGPAPFRSEDHL